MKARSKDGKDYSDMRAAQQWYAEALQLCLDNNPSKLDAQLANNAFVAGDRFTVADITAMFLLRGAKAQEFDLSACPNIERWFAEVSARPCFS